MKPTRRDQVDHIRLKAAGRPGHINAREEALLRREMPQAAGPVITRGLLAEAGIAGDDRVTNLIPAEAKILKRHGGSGDRNPITGLLQYGDGMGGDSNPGGGHNADGPSGGPSSSGGYGPGPSSGPSGGGYYGGDVNTKPDIANMSLSQLQDQFSNRGYSIESLLSLPNNYRAPGYEDLPGAFQYSPPDTFGRLRDTYLHGPPPSYTERGKLPGRRDAPTGLGPGFGRQAVASLAGPAGGVMSGLMSLGVHMDQAMSPETRAASLAENQAQGSKNSTGRDDSGFSDNAPGTASGSVTAAQQVADTTTAPGYVIAPDGRISRPRSDRTLSGLPQPVQNLLIDYLWRGQGGGLLG